MKKLRRSSLIALVVAAVMLASGCASEYGIETTAAPHSKEATTAPQDTTKPVNQIPSDDFGVTLSGKYRDDLLAVSASDRTTEMGWVCLNEYLTPENPEDQALLDGNTDTVRPLQDCLLKSDRKLFVWAVEYVFSGPVPYDTAFSFGKRAETIGFVNFSELKSDTVDRIPDRDDPTGGFYVFPDNSVWVERKDTRVLMVASDPTGLQISCIDLFRHPVSVSEIRIYGKVME